MDAGVGDGISATGSTCQFGRSVSPAVAEDTLEGRRPIDELTQNGLSPRITRLLRMERREGFG
jgi:hypothetical protein